MYVNLCIVTLISCYIINK